jgi:pyruvate formate lyase activating enzyme
MTHTGLVNKILRHSFVDGPGSRAVIFLQGCTLGCLYCHNPYTMNVCNHCGECLPVCRHGALSLVEGRVLWSAALCAECDACIDACPRHASPRVRAMTPREVWRELEPAAPFISGVTVSGGEPTLQIAFLRDFFALLKAETALTTLIETNGCLVPSRLDPLLPLLDAAMVDLKAWEPSTHRALTGQDNRLVKETIRYLASHGKLHAVRQVIAPGYTDNEENMIGTALFLAGIDPAIPLRLLRFRPHGARGPARQWLPPDDRTLDHLVAVARSAGLRDVERSL